MSRAGTDRYDQIFHPPRRRHVWRSIILALIGLVGLMPLGFYLYDVYGYSTFEHRINADGLAVRYGLLRLELPASEIAGVSLEPDPPAMQRVAGVATSSIRRGWFNLPDYGRVYRLTTDRAPVVFVDTKPTAVNAEADTRYVFSPEQPELFLELLAAAIRGDFEATIAGAGAAVPAVTFDPLPSPNPAGDRLLLLTALLSLLVVGMGYVLILRGSSSLRYRVGPNGIGVFHLFGEHVFNWAGITDVGPIDHPIRGMRVVGASLPGYHVGSFHVRGVGTVRLFATDPRPPLVMVQSKQGRIVLSPADVDQFMAAVDRFRPS